VALTAITRKPGANLGDCELTFVGRQSIDTDRALEQHGVYEACLAESGVRVVSLAADPAHPDGVFVEDTAIVLDEAAIIGRAGVETRRGEAAEVAGALRRYRPLCYVSEPATLEGGDVLRAGKTLYAGASRRTNREGIAALAELAERFGYRVVPVAVMGCLHLKTGCCVLPDGRLLGHRAWIGGGALEGGWIEVPAEEPWGANVLVAGSTVVAPASAPRTCELLERSGFRVRSVEIGELQKAEGGLTCMSIVFEGAP
jgi:dimethylargininase